MDGWTEFQDDAVFGGSEDYVGDNGVVNPGRGGQRFDAEYLLYQYNSTTNILSIGLQAGFNLINGVEHFGSKLLCWRHRIIV